MFCNTKQVMKKSQLFFSQFRYKLLQISSLFDSIRPSSLTIKTTMATARIQGAKYHLGEYLVRANHRSAMNISQSRYTYTRYVYDERESLGMTGNKGQTGDLGFEIKTS